MVWDDKLTTLTMANGAQSVQVISGTVSASGSDGTNGNMRLEHGPEGNVALVISGFIPDSIIKAPIGSTCLVAAHSTASNKGLWLNADGSSSWKKASGVS